MEVPRGPRIGGGENGARLFRGWSLWLFDPHFDANQCCQAPNFGQDFLMRVGIGWLFHGATVWGRE